AGNDGGTLFERPTMPLATIASIAGVLAACSGVLPPSDSCGSSAAPSGMMMAYFIKVQNAKCRMQNSAAAMEVRCPNFALCTLHSKLSSFVNSHAHANRPGAG